MITVRQSFRVDRLFQSYWYPRRKHAGNKLSFDGWCALFRKHILDVRMWRCWISSFFWVRSSTLTPTRPWNCWQRTNAILIIQWAKGSNLLIQIPLPIWTQTLWWYNIWLCICIWYPWLFEQVNVSLNCITPILDKDVSRRRWRETEVMQLLDACNLL